MAEKPKDNTKTVTLVDNTEIPVRALKLSLLRPFMLKFAELAAVAEDNDKSMDILMDCVQIAMKQYKPELADDRDQLEELLDLPTVYKIVDAASGFNNSDASVVAGLTK